MLYYGKISKGDMMSIKIGETNQMVVVRKTDIGYMLDDEPELVFLHNNDTNHQILNPGDVVFAFIYFDNKGRVAATLKKPLIEMNRPAFLEVTAINPSLGVFLEMGINKELLLSKDDLPLDMSSWPQKGDMLYVSLRLKGRLVAKRCDLNEITLKPTEPLTLKQTVSAYVHRIGKQGVNLITKAGHVIFVHESLVKEPIRYGQLVDVKITYISEKGYSGSLGEQKEVQMHEDARNILSYIVRNGAMDLTSDSSSEAIYETFKLSKKAFKRALGSLYKQRRIDFKDNQTVLVIKKGEKNEQ
jgi:hypothetical protein